MFKKIILIGSLFLLVSNFLFGYDYLRVRDPRNWGSIQGTIEEATVSIKPKGLYMEVGLYLTFSARDWYNSSNDSLEVEFYFDLPENSIVNDSWLWIEDEIIRGEIMDKWTAAAIYEDIVKRRQDPSILYKRSGYSYELRIFPMLASEKRKVKITYLVPAEWNANKILASLPTQLLQTSKYPVTQFYLLTWVSNEWKNPQISEFPNIQFQSFSDSTFGNYLRASIPTDAVNSSINFSLDSPFKNGIYLNKFNNGNEGIYQLAFLPSKALGLSTTSKIAILFDYDASNSTISKNEVLNGVKSQLLSNFTEMDSINLIFSQLNIKRASEKWISADSISIENAFSNLGSEPISSYSNLPSLLANGIDFIKNNGNLGNIVLVSSSDQVGQSNVANQLINDLIAIMNPKIPIHIADFQNENYDWNYIGGQTYYGNEYFYTNISRITSANHFIIRSGLSFTQLLSSTFGSVSGFMNSFDVHTSLVNGYCYSRFNTDEKNSSTYLSKPIIQIGKYQGDMPFVIEASGVFNNEVFSRKIEIPEQNIFDTDTISKKVWTGNYIKKLESEEQTNSVVSEIIDYSISNRVLSIYSAFLCLEPSRGGVVCFDCMDESQLVDVNVFKHQETDSLHLSAYPNPFNNEVQLRISLPASEITENVTFKIYNILGQVVKNFEVAKNDNSETYNFSWFGKNDSGSIVSSGTYFFVAETQRKRHSLKLLYIK